MSITARIQVSFFILIIFLSLKFYFFDCRANLQAMEVIPHMPFLFGKQFERTVWREVQFLCLIETTHFVELVIADFCLIILSSKALLIVGAVHKFDGVFKFHNVFLSF